MKDKNKALLLTGAVAITIGMAGMVNANITSLPKLNAPIVQAYNHHPANILDNVFEKDGTTILPFIYESPDQTISKETVISEFNKAGLTIKSISKNTIGTGTTIAVNENSKVYTVLVYGDVNGDGKVNLIDAQKVIMHHKFGGTNTLSNIYFIAGNVSNNNNTVINLIDAQRIIMLKKGLTNQLVVVEPTSNKEADKTAPAITLKGTNPMEVQIGNVYTEPGATATDNYDGNVTSKIQITGTVNTSKLGTYTITYTVTDSNGNKAVKTRTVKVVDKITSISMKTNPNKTNYNFGETTIDITGATIELHMETGNSTVINVTNDMLSSYDLSTEGTKTMTVTYLGKTTSFEVKVLDKISALEVNNNGMSSNVQLLEGGYQMNSQEEFILGMIKQKDIADTSILKLEQLSVEKSVVATTDNTVTANDLTITFAVDASGNIIIKGKANKAGKYTVTPYITYGENKVKTAPMQLNAVPSTVVSKIELKETIADGEVKYNKKQVVQKQIVVMNEHNEEIEVAGKDFTFENVSNGITITKLDADKNPITDANGDKKIKYIEIATTLKTEQTVSFGLKVGTIQKTIRFKIGNESTLTKAVIDAEKLELYLEAPNGVGNVVEKDGNIYTVLPIKFLNQDNEEMNIEANKLLINNAENGKVNILLPEVQVFVKVGDIEIPRNENGAISVIYYAENGSLAEGSNYVSKIGFSVLLNSADKRVNLATLAGKEITIQCNGEITKIPVQVKFAELRNLSITTKNSTLSKDTEGNYVTDLNKEFTLGTMVVNQNEQPVTPEMLETIINSFDDKTGIQIRYEKDSNGNILIKGTATKPGIYEITPHVGSVNSKVNVIVKAVGIPTITGVTIEKTSIQIGQTVETKVHVTSDLNSTDEPIKAKDFKIELPNDNLKITLLDEDGVEIDISARPDVVVKYLRLEIKDTVTTDEDITATITLFEGKTNEYVTNKTFSIYSPIPRTVEIGNNISLYNIANTNTVEKDGKVYTLLPVKVYADVAKTRQIANDTSLFAITGDTTNKVRITLPKVDVTLNGTIPTTRAMLDVKYFDKDKNAVSQGEFAYIGIAIVQPTTGVLEYNKEDLTGKNITLTCETGFTTNIEITYAK